MAYFRQVKKGLNNFNSKIQSQVKASPAQFAQVLMNPFLRPQFKFGCAPRNDESEIDIIRKDSIPQYQDYIDLEFTLIGNNAIKQRRNSMNETDMNRVSKQDVKFNFHYDSEEEKFYIQELSYDLQRVFVMWYDPNVC